MLTDVSFTAFKISARCQLFYLLLTIKLLMKADTSIINTQRLFYKVRYGEILL
jgi:hypothetical protein